MNQPDLTWIYELYLLAQRSAVEPDVQSGRERLLRHIVTIFGASSGSLSEIDADRGTLKIVAGIDLPKHVIGSTVAFGAGILGWVAEHGTPLLLNGSLASDPRFKKRVRRENQAPDSALCWPLVVEDEPVGVISINRGPAHEPFTLEDLCSGFNAIRFVAIAVENARLHERSARYVKELKRVLARFEETQSHLMHAEKMASLGQLAAGVAHEINNPIGYIGSNLNTLREYVDDLLGLLRACEAGGGGPRQEPDHSAAQVPASADVAHLKQDVISLIDESMEGVDRVRQIVRSLKEFSHVGTGEWAWADLHAVLDSTLNIVQNELKYKAEVVKEYGNLPPVECMIPQLIQVFVNMLVNAAQAIEGRGVVTLSTGLTATGWVWVAVSDTGKGIAPEDLTRIFEPFYTTKPVGMGTGLGLPLSCGIVERHGGRMDVESEPGRGSTFRVWLPMSRANDLAAGGGAA